jgi:hypothetical protein
MNGRPALTARTPITLDVLPASQLVLRGPEKSPDMRWRLHPSGTRRGGRVESSADASRNPVMNRFVPLLALLLLGASGCERKSPPSQGTPGSSSSPLASAAPRPASEEQGPILIGSIGSLTGSEASFGGPIRDAIQLAVEEVNAAGGVQGRRVELRSYDSQGRVEESVGAVQRLISKDHVRAIIGDDSSSATLAIAGMAQAAQIPLVTPGATQPDVTRKGDYIFRTCFIDPFAKTKDFPAVSGRITLDAERNPVKPAAILKVQGGKREFVTAVTP